MGDFATTAPSINNTFQHLSNTTGCAKTVEHQESNWIPVLGGMA